jgi:uncharacterized membrane protein SirB2
MCGFSIKQRGFVGEPRIALVFQPSTNISRISDYTKLHKNHRRGKRANIALNTELVQQAYLYICGSIWLVIKNNFIFIYTNKTIKWLLKIYCCIFENIFLCFFKLRHRRKHFKNISNWSKSLIYWFAIQWLISNIFCVYKLYLCE